nr:MAG TPA: hypothetical protein [Caudoviricetes sp.]
MPAAPAIIGAVAAAVGTGYSIYSGERSAKKQAQAQRQAETQAEQQKLQAERDFNRANSKKADTAGALAAAQQPGGGVSGTMLTGADGVDGDKLKLGRQNLLGKTSLLG